MFSMYIAVYSKVRLEARQVLCLDIL